MTKRPDGVSDAAYYFCRRLLVSIRTSNLLMTMGVTSIAEVLALTEAKTLCVPGLGETSWKEIAQLQYELGPEGDESRRLETIKDLIQTLNAEMAALEGLLNPDSGRHWLAIDANGCVALHKRITP